MNKTLYLPDGVNSSSKKDCSIPQVRSAISIPWGSKFLLTLSTMILIHEDMHEKSEMLKVLSVQRRLQTDHDF